MTECLFYEIRGRALEKVLADLLEKSLQRGWRVLVRAGSKERVLDLNAKLWTYKDDSFLPHGCFKDGDAAEQPVYLEEPDEDAGNPNGAEVLVLAEGGTASDWNNYQRCITLLDGFDDEQIEQAKTWRESLAAEGVDAVWWRQGDKGWEKD
ncbi:MAG: DNA polymerase III subunit chi [Hyphomicrobiales bacterium]|nr:DNA polymerase III subunit chi [Hyphomicrobiales bacterium]MCY4049097.1 DNA polymerase III subunit chi [Hyphomicrobiales bacterium]MCY4053149.1 DNA polymerase III subunit chi [Hyphomicrobiales bacterium]